MRCKKFSSELSWKKVPHAAHWGIPPALVSVWITETWFPCWSRISGGDGRAEPFRLKKAAGKHEVEQKDVFLSDFHVKAEHQFNQLPCRPWTHHKLQQKFGTRRVTKAGSQTSSLDQHSTSDLLFGSESELRPPLREVRTTRTTSGTETWCHVGRQTFEPVRNWT